MPRVIDLADFEKTRPYKGHYKRDLAAVQERLDRILVAHIVRDRRAVVMFEGWDAAGKGGIIQRLADRRGEGARFPLALPPRAARTG
jgi:polyphosphate kinase 2 (PPK2 family)